MSNIVTTSKVTILPPDVTKLTGRKRVIKYRYKLNENVNKYLKHVDPNVHHKVSFANSFSLATDQWMWYNHRVSTFEPMLRNKRDIKIGYVDMEIVNVATNEVEFSTLPSPMPDRFYEATDLFLMTPAQLTELCFAYRLYDTMSQKQKIETIIKCQMERGWIAGQPAPVKPIPVPATISEPEIEPENEAAETD